jgi:hypothetical protein
MTDTSVRNEGLFPMVDAFQMRLVAAVLLLLMIAGIAPAAAAEACASECCCTAPEPVELRRDGAACCPDSADCSVAAAPTTGQPATLLQPPSAGSAHLFSTLLASTRTVGGPTLSIAHSPPPLQRRLAVLSILLI